MQSTLLTSLPLYQPAAWLGGHLDPAGQLTQAKDNAPEASPSGSGCAVLQLQRPAVVTGTTVKGRCVHPAHP